jgi:hypothetical protein
MTTRRESELQIVEVKAPLSPKKLPRPMRPPQRRPAPTRAEALEAIRATKGAESVIARVPALGQIGVWGDLASWNACQTTGAADGIPTFWSCDFDATYTLSYCFEYCLPFFAAEETVAGTPKTVGGVGQVWCYLNAPASGLYLFVVQVETPPITGRPPSSASLTLTLRTPSAT